MSTLITEVFEQKLETLYEEVDGKKALFIEGIFLQANIKNRNGRIYPTSVMEREVTNYTTSHINENRAWGELNHPPTPTINLDRVSHRCVSLRKEGDNWVGKARIVDTPMGMIARQLIESGGQLGTSSRGLGSLKKNSMGIMEVQDDFRLMVAGDIVSDPSAPSAYVKGIMEGAEWVYDIASGNWVMAEHIDHEQKHLKQLNKNELNETAALKAWNRFLEKLTDVSK
jgi:hypothetical protein